MNKWKFYINPAGNAWGTIRFLASVENGGYLFYGNGSPTMDKIDPSYNFKHINGNTSFYKEVTLKKAFSLLRDENARKNVYKILRIPQNTIEVSKEIEKELVNKLNEVKALNADSAFKFEDEKWHEIAYSVVDKGSEIVKEYKDRFYLNELLQKELTL